MLKIRYAQLRYLSIIILAWLAVFFLTRSFLWASHFKEITGSWIEFCAVYLTGFIYDAVFLLYAIIPLSLYLLLCPQWIWHKNWHRQFLHILVGGSFFVMLFISAAEWLFWDEFGVRFNFIAVDYLIYSKEVIHNILESYPIYPLLSILAVVAVGATVTLKKYITEAIDAPLLSKSLSTIGLVSIWFIAALSSITFGQDFPNLSFSNNTYQRELARNGPFQFFAAFRNNELDYTQFYAVLPDSEVATIIRREVSEPNAHFIGRDPQDIRRLIDNTGPIQKKNVILVTIESFSAQYLGSMGNQLGLTPHLDALRKDSLFFNNTYATGTRTDRGLEAITLSIPPTPGRSIVKRIGRESGYSSLGQQFNAQGYDSVFIYGGRGYFDNMNAFFSGNGYRIVDQSSVPESDMHFTNAWGMSDEDLYTQTLKVADIDFAAKKPFFLQLMTTSNHRPYTYPSGRIDIASGTGREGAVKYTDYAIGQFLAQAQKKPWFDETVFVFIADHTAGSAGKEDLPPSNYHIPLFVYAPGFIPAREVGVLTSQIDVAPTLLGLLGFNYTSTFFGRNVLREDAAPGRVLIGNYQHLGLFDGKNLAILSPRRTMRRHNDALKISSEIQTDSQDLLTRRDIAYYQSASYIFKKGLINWTHELGSQLKIAK